VGWDEAPLGARLSGVPGPRPASKPGKRAAATRGERRAGAPGLPARLRRATNNSRETQTHARMSKKAKAQKVTHDP